MKKLKNIFKKEIEINIFRIIIDFKINSHFSIWYKYKNHPTLKERCLFDIDWRCGLSIGFFNNFIEKR